MSAIFKREFKTFFTSPIGYFVLAVLFGFSGFYFFATNMYAGSADLSGCSATTSGSAPTKPCSPRR